MEKNLYNLMLKERRQYDVVISNKGYPLFLGKDKSLITKEECQNYIDEIYKVFDKCDFIKASVNSSKSDIKFFLNQVIKYIQENKIKNFEYNYPHLGYIHSYFINKGWINIIKSMELFLRYYYPDEDITNAYIRINIRKNNKESMEYKLLHFNPDMIPYIDYKKEKKIKRELARKLIKSGSISNLLTVAEYNYSINTWDSNRQARKACIEVFYKAHNVNEKLEALDLLLTHQVKVNFAFKSNFKIDEIIEEVNKYKGYKGWMSCLHTIVCNLIEGYGCKKNVEKAKEVFTSYSGYTLEEIKDNSKFDEIFNNFYQLEYKNREKELNLK